MPQSRGGKNERLTLLLDEHLEQSLALLLSVSASNVRRALRWSR